MNRLKDLKVDVFIHKTRFKDRILEHFPDAQAQNVSKNVVIVFESGMQHLLKDSLMKRDYSEEANILAKAASIIRKDIFDHKIDSFSGSFPDHCQEESIPSTLKSLISMILVGKNLKHQEKKSQPCLTISQLLVFNSKKKQSNSENTRHTLQHEPPLPMFIGLQIHSVTRSKKMIQQLYRLGLSVSYDRIMQVNDQVAKSLCERFDADGVVAPSQLQKGLFTVGAMDNIDHNPSSNTATGSFHGTGISLFQFTSSSGVVRPPVKIPPEGNIETLPENFSNVPVVSLQTSTISVPECKIDPTALSIPSNFEKEKQWVQHALPLLKKDLTVNDKISWAAYHASSHSSEVSPGTF